MKTMATSMTAAIGEPPNMIEVVVEVAEDGHPRGIIARGDCGGEVVVKGDFESICRVLMAACHLSREYRYHSQPPYCCPDHGIHAASYECPVCHPPPPPAPKPLAERATEVPVVATEGNPF